MHAPRPGAGDGDEKGVGAAPAAQLPQSRPSFARRLWITAETLAYGLAGGLAFTALGMPAGLLTGAIFATGVAAMAGRPVAIPEIFVGLVFALIGLLIGMVVTPAQVAVMPSLIPSLALLAVSTTAATCVSTLYLRAVHRWDPLSAMLASVPGAHSQILIAAFEAGANVQGIAMVQVLRSSLLALLLPTALVQFEGAANLAAAVPSMPLDLLSAAAIAVAAGLGALLFLKLRLPGGLLLGAMIPVGILHGTGLVQGDPPAFLRDGSFLLLGTIVGTRLGGITRQELIHFSIAALVSLALAFLTVIGFIVIAIAYLDAQTAVALLSFTPGAMDTIVVLSLSMGIDPTIVGTHQIFRVLTISFALPLLISLLPTKAPPGGTSP